MSRSVPEWIGNTDNEAPPPRVRVRVFERFKGVCQCGCKTVIRPGMAWQADHKLALINGGENRERNMVPLLTDHHKVKTANDVAIKSKTYRMRSKHVGVKKPRTMTRWRKFNGDIVNAPRER